MILYGFYHGIHHHFSPPFGEYYVCFVFFSQAPFSVANPSYKIPTFCPSRFAPHTQQHQQLTGSTLWFKCLACKSCMPFRFPKTEVLKGTSVKGKLKVNWSERKWWTDELNRWTSLIFGGSTNKPGDDWPKISLIIFNPRKLGINDPIWLAHFWYLFNQRSFDKPVYLISENEKYSIFLDSKWDDTDLMGFFIIHNRNSVSFFLENKLQRSFPSTLFLKPAIQLPKKSRWRFHFFIFTPILGRFPIWLAHIFQMGWFNHQPDMVLTMFSRLFSYQKPLRFSRN